MSAEELTALFTGLTVLIMTAGYFQASYTNRLAAMPFRPKTFVGKVGENMYRVCVLKETPYAIAKITVVKARWWYLRRPAVLRQVIAWSVSDLGENVADQLGPSSSSFSLEEPSTEVWFEIEPKPKPKAIDLKMTADSLRCITVRINIK